MELLLSLLDIDLLTFLQEPLSGAALTDSVNTAEASKIIGLPPYDAEDFYKLAMRFIFNFAAVGILAGLIYFPKTRRKDYLFTYILISITVFFLCFLLENVKLELGFALGLFAIFGIIRYRTDPIPIREMTYLFIIIGLSVINALANKKISFAELVLANGCIIMAAVALEYVQLFKNEVQKVVLFEKIDLIKPEKMNELHADLEARTGLKINRVEVGKIDFLRDVASIKIYYFDQNQDLPSRASYEDNGGDL